MRPDYTLVRDALPFERLSCARIRQWLAEDTDLGCWSRTSPRAIRPQHLAALIRDRIWEAHDVPLATVRGRLEREGDDKQAPYVDYWVKIEIEKGANEGSKLLARTRFSLTTGGRVRAEICLAAKSGEHCLTDGAVTLRRHDRD